MIRRYEASIYSGALLLSLLGHWLLIGGLSSAAKTTPRERSRVLEFEVVEPEPPPPEPEPEPEKPEPPPPPEPKEVDLTKVEVPEEEVPPPPNVPDGEEEPEEVEEPPSSVVSSLPLSTQLTRRRRVKESRS